jgi:hypothetical protein
MTTPIPAASPRPPYPAQGPTAPTRVSVPNDGGIEAIILDLENQTRRSRELRNDARDARRDQQALGIRQAHKSARIALAGSLVRQVGEAAASFAQSAARGGETDADASGAQAGARPAPDGSKAVCGDAPMADNATITGEPAGGETSGASKVGNTPDHARAAAIAQSAAAGVEAAGTVIDHFAQRAATRGEVADHAAQTYGDVAADAEQAAQDARGMVDRARQHLDAILTARRDAEAAILRG